MSRCARQSGNAFATLRPTFLTSTTTLCRTRFGFRPLGELDAEAIVAARALGTRGGIAEVVEDELSPAIGEVGVALHHVELGDVGGAPAGHRGPVDSEIVQRMLWTRETTA